jgi:hypothetical protein
MRPHQGCPGTSRIRITRGSCGSSADAPAPLLRALFDATRLTIDMHEDSNDVTLTVTLPVGDLPAVAETTQELAADLGEPEPVLVDVVRAPGGIRTHTGRCLRALSLPVGLQGRRGGTAARRA